MIARSLCAAILVLGLTGRAQDPPELTHGPIVGHVETQAARIWARFSKEGEYQVVVRDGAGRDIARTTARAFPANDLTLVWEIRGLRPSQSYTYVITQGPRTIAGGKEYTFRTPPSSEAKARVRLAVGSCAHDKRFPSQPIWTRMQQEGAEVIVLLGDTPYIDSTELEVQHRRYREFYGLPEFARTVRSTPLLAIWDDHDFGADESDGSLAGKESSRRAFLNYHANPSYGDGTRGIYTKFRWGPVEVFLLDTRWFAGTEPSPVSADQPSLLGQTQWEWLRRELASSTATFKILASGMIWNGAVRPGKRDHWMSYPHERDAVFRFIGENKISGVVLMGGDIHRSRAFRYATEPTVGYALTELIASPLANTVIEAANVPHPDLLHDSGPQQSFMLLTVDTEADPPSLVAQVLDHEGREHFAVRLDATMLSPKRE